MLNYNFDEKSNDVINNAFASARDLGHAFVGTEHLVLGLSMISGVKLSEVLDDYGVTTERLNEEIIKLIGRGKGGNSIEDYTRHAKDVLRRSYGYALKTNNAEIMPEHIFLSIMHENQCMGYRILKNSGLDFSKILLEPTPKIGKIIKENQSGAFEIKTMDLLESYEEKDALQMGVDLTEMAKDVPFEDVFGRDGIIDRMIQVLSRKTKNNICLVGDPGVGKTAIVHGLANRLASRNLSEELKGKRLIEVNIASLVSGTSYRGQFEERMQKWMEQLLRDDDVIVFFDEFHNLIGTGATGEKSLDAVGLMKPHLATGKIQLIGATTYEEFHKYIEPDQALVRRLTLVDVDEPSDTEALDIMRHIKVNYEQHHNVIISEEAIESAVYLSKRYIIGRRLPDKAIDLIDEACSRKRFENLKNLELIDELKYRLNRLRQEKEDSLLEMDLVRASKIQDEEKKILSSIEKDEAIKTLMATQKLVVTKSDVEHVVSEWTGVPIHKMSAFDVERLRQLPEHLGARILGQNHAVESVSRALKRMRIGIQTPNRPTGVFMFVGPTGVGKTELAKTIAEIYYGDERQLIQVDMSEYMEKHSVSKLIGSPPGYEGNREGGHLTNAVKKNPYSVVLFDEVEKAHPEVLDVLLQLMDEGKLKDGKGFSIDFRNTLIVLTSNIGSEFKASRKMGFSTANSDILAEEYVRDACKAYFRPEFLNRIDEVVVFNPLDLESAALIVRQYVDAFSRQMAIRQIVVNVSDTVCTYIAERYYTQAYGARPLSRAVDREIKDVVSDILLDTEFAKNEISFNYNQEDGCVYVED
ncbi:ATP-dependent Clp protease ATP-binding subunit [Fusibacter tunisiensis]|uniref:ATP-dependent Clp protease ATP-binding subunit ClpC n=1 Tax=Fusibacter tunisiensis TaxID=1008308 RepID=A0ABS2MQT2_9FIRM|nr:ATP-dependent Clp protease ATP-binding subunit [Fusibacter tunisiensis]MBM7561765.1 ATP-dependent Clp protease ATP-binding subunit ClpC [Fusibacter tunisiensis]